MERPGLGAAVAEQVADDPVEAVGLVDHEAQELVTRRGRVHGAAAKVRGDGAHRRQRRARVVRHTAQQHRALLVDVLERDDARRFSLATTELGRRRTHDQLSEHERDRCEHDEGRDVFRQVDPQRAHRRDEARREREHCEHRRHEVRDASPEEGSDEHRHHEEERRNRPRHCRVEGHDRDDRDSRRAEPDAEGKARRSSGDAHPPSWPTGPILEIFNSVPEKADQTSRVRRTCPLRRKRVSDAGGNHSGVDQPRPGGKAGESTRLGMVPLAPCRGRHVSACGVAGGGDRLAGI